MDDKARHRLDALVSLNNQEWAEFQEKTQVEWRLSFALWTALVAVIGGILGGKATELLIPFWMKLGAVFVCVALVFLHLVFLLWIQKRLGHARSNLTVVRYDMWSLVRLGTPQGYGERRRAPCQPSLWVQLSITLVLSGVLLSSLFLRPVEKRQVADLNNSPAVPSSRQN